MLSVWAGVCRGEISCIHWISNCGISCISRISNPVISYSLRILHGKWYCKWYPTTIYRAVGYRTVNCKIATIRCSFLYEQLSGNFHIFIFYRANVGFSAIRRVIVPRISQMLPINRSQKCSNTSHKNKSRVHTEKVRKIWKPYGLL